MECPLCGSTISRARCSLRLSEVLAEIDSYYGTRLVAAGQAADQAVTLRSCRRCSLQFFDPPVAADAAFYNELGAADMYYSPGLRWDQRLAVDVIGRSARVIDVGAGAGLFVGELRSRGIDAMGIDFRDGESPRPEGVAASAAGNDHLLVDLGNSAELSATAAQIGGSADVATAFHVLEHLHQPVEFARFLRSLVGPGGRVIVSVPNRHRFDPAPSQALDCPPHHLTRWSKANLELLGSTIGATSCEVSVEHDFGLRRMVVGSARWVLNRLRRNAALDARVGAPWPPWRVVNAQSLLAVYRFDPR